MKIGTSIIIFFLAIIALVAEFILYMIFGIGVAFEDASALPATAFFFVGLMVISGAAGVLAPLSAVLGMIIKNQKLSLKVYLGLLGLILVGMVAFGIFGTKSVNTAITEKSTETLKSTSPTISNPTPKVDLNKKVNVTVVNKEFREVGYQSFIVIPVKIYNYTNKDIKGASGTLTFYDIFGNKIKVITFNYDDAEGLPHSTVTDYEAGMDFNQFIDSDVKLRDTDFQNLKYEWVTEIIIYSDGTEERN